MHDSLLCCVSTKKTTCPLESHVMVMQLSRREQDEHCRPSGSRRLYPLPRFESFVTLTRVRQCMCWTGRSFACVMSISDLMLKSSCRQHLNLKRLLVGTNPRNWRAPTPKTGPFGGTPCTGNTALLRFNHGSGCVGVLSLVSAVDGFLNCLGLSIPLLLLLASQLLLSFIVKRNRHHSGSGGPRHQDKSPPLSVILFFHVFRASRRRRDFSRENWINCHQCQADKLGATPTAHVSGEKSSPTAKGITHH